MNAQPLLHVHGLSVSHEENNIIHSINLEVLPGEVHVLMGPNGSGKSTFVQALMGNPLYNVTGEAMFRGKDLFSMDPSERAKMGLFLAFQYPREISGVIVRQFLLAAHTAQRGEKTPLTPLQFKKILHENMKSLSIPQEFSERFLNKGFSGGEKKKAEVLQLSVLKPTLALLDETDSGLDIDALRIVSKAVNALRSKERSFLIVTHYARILEYLKPDKVHVMVGGQIRESGGPELSARLEKEGYEKFGLKKAKK